MWNSRPFPRAARICSRASRPGARSGSGCCWRRTWTRSTRTDEQFTPRTRNGRLFGRGACDTKGSVAAMLTALIELAQGRQRPAETEIIFAGLVDEEQGQAGSRALVSQWVQGGPGDCRRAHAFAGGDGAQGHLVDGVGNARQVRPRLMAGAGAQRGSRRWPASSICWKPTTPRSCSRRRHPLLGCATISVGAICGGSQANIVPDRCSILIDRRTLPGETEAGVRREINSACCGRKHLTVAFVQDKLPPCLPLETDPRLPLVARFLQSVGPAQAGGRALLLRCLGARARRHPQRGVRPGGHCAGAYGGRMDFPRLHWSAAKGCCCASCNRFLEPERPWPPPSLMPAEKVETSARDRRRRIAPHSSAKAAGSWSPPWRAGCS